MLERVKRYEAWFSSPFGRRADRVEKRIMRGLLAGFVESRSLLDAGCGTGHFTGWFADSGLYAIGLDRSPSMLAFARGRRPDVPFLLGDATSLPFSDDTFDIVALVNVIEFLGSPDLALREAGRVARHGLLLGVLNSRSPVALWRRLRKAEAYRCARFFSAGQLERLVHDSLAPRRVSIRRRTGLCAVPWLDRFADLPYGAFIGLSARFE